MSLSVYVSKLALRILDKTKRSRSSEAGFTLVELLVVMVILVLLAGLVAPRVVAYLGSSKTKTAKIQIENLVTSLELYKLDNGAYPKNHQGLKALMEAPAGANNWNGPYLNKKSVPADPWGNAYHYDAPGRHGEFDLYSFGADNQQGGEGENADVGNW